MFMQVFPQMKRVHKSTQCSVVTRLRHVLHHNRMTMRVTADALRLHESHYQECVSRLRQRTDL